MKRQNDEELIFTLDHVFSNNVQPFKDQQASRHHAVLLPLRKSHGWSSTKYLWFIATDPNTREFLEYLNEDALGLREGRKRCALRTGDTEVSDRNRALLNEASKAVAPETKYTKLLDQRAVSDEPIEYVVKYIMPQTLGLRWADQDGKNAIVLRPQCTDCNDKDGNARGWICTKADRSFWFSKKCKPEEQDHCKEWHDPCPKGFYCSRLNSREGTQNGALIGSKVITVMTAVDDVQCEGLPHQDILDIINKAHSQAMSQKEEEMRFMRIRFRTPVRDDVLALREAGRLPTPAEDNRNGRRRLLQQISS